MVFKFYLSKEKRSGIRYLALFIWIQLLLSLTKHWTSVHIISRTQKGECFGCLFLLEGAAGTWSLGNQRRELVRKIYAIIYISCFQRAREDLNSHGVLLNLFIINLDSLNYGNVIDKLSICILVTALGSLKFQLTNLIPKRRNNLMHNPLWIDHTNFFMSRLHKPRD